MYAAEVDWSGTEYWSFGVWGTSGSDLSHLNATGHGIEYIYSDWLGHTYFISDMRNHRVLEVNDAGNVERWYPCRYPRMVTQHPYIKNIGIGSEGSVGYLIEGHHGDLRYYTPHRTNFVNPTIYDTVFAGWYHYGFEYDLRSVRPWRKPLGGKEEFSLNANEESTTIPIHGMGVNQVTVYARSTQSATLNIYYPNSLPMRGKYSLSLDPSEPWIQADSVSLSANTLATYPFSNPLIMMGASIEMGGTAGDAELWINENVIR